MNLSGSANSLSLCSTKPLIAIGGRDLLKVVQVRGQEMVEKRNLRVGKANGMISTVDVRWHPSMDNIFASSTSNGSVIIWNINRDKPKYAQERVFTEHQRAVNRVDWHPADVHLFASASQDGSVKLWDRRARSSSSATFRPKSESIRDIRFNPFYHSKFALAFENGIVQVWDSRKPLQPELKFTAHKGLVLALDWRPSKSMVLATGSRDRSIKIWHLADTKQPEHIVQTIASVGRIQWRNGFPDQIGSAASMLDNSVHVWNVQEPHIPLVSWTGHEDNVAGFSFLHPSWLDMESQYGDGSLRHTQNAHMIACSKDGQLKIHTLSNALKPMESIRTAVIALSPIGGLAMAHDPIDRSSAAQSLSNQPLLAHPTAIAMKKSASTVGLPLSDNIGSPRSNFVSRVLPSWSSESINTQQPQNASFIATKAFPAVSLHATNPVGGEENVPWFRTPEALITVASSTNEVQGEKNTLKYFPQCFGFNHLDFIYYAKNYKLTGKPFDFLCEYNALVADKRNNPKLRQVWQVLKLLFQATPSKLLSPRSDYVQRNPIDRSKDSLEGTESADCASLLQQLDTVNPLAMQRYDTSPFVQPGKTAPQPASHRSSNGIGSNVSIKSQFRSLNLVHGPVVQELLKYYADLGDVQTCVSVTLVLGHVIDVEAIISKIQIQKYYMHYLDLLHQLKLYTEANRLVTLSADSSISQMNMRSTTIYPNCAKCNKPLDAYSPTEKGNGGKCSNCFAQASECSLCQQATKGLYSWCPVCGHGGHLSCLKRWFTTQQLCPTGCLHKCSLKYA